MSRIDFSQQRIRDILRVPVLKKKIIFYLKSSNTMVIQIELHTHAPTFAQTTKAAFSSFVNLYKDQYIQSDTQITPVVALGRL
jgi:hypothetical protein